MFLLCVSVRTTNSRIRTTKRPRVHVMLLPEPRECCPQRVFLDPALLLLSCHQVPGKCHVTILIDLTKERPNMVVLIGAEENDVMFLLLPTCCRFAKNKNFDS